MASGPTHLVLGTRLGHGLRARPSASWRRTTRRTMPTVLQRSIAKSMADEFGTGHGPIEPCDVRLDQQCFCTCWRQCREVSGSPVTTGSASLRLLIVGGAHVLQGGLFAMSAGIGVVARRRCASFGVGVMGIFGGGLFNRAPLFSTHVPMWFVRHRAVAQGIVATGSGLGTMLFVQRLAPMAVSRSIRWRSCGHEGATQVVFSWNLCRSALHDQAAAEDGHGRPRSVTSASGRCDSAAILADVGLGLCHLLPWNLVIQRSLGRS